VGLEARGHHRAGELSGGEQQRVALARALVTGPQILMADEPTGDLDNRTAEMVFDLVQRLHRDYRLTSLIVTHNLDFARRCDRVLRLHQGQVDEVLPDSLPH
jgi:lipoprotein-releasing system ATP-binding protein